jgi:hypothetical protein
VSRERFVCRSRRTSDLAFAASRLYPLDSSRVAAAATSWDATFHFAHPKG